MQRDKCMKQKNTTTYTKARYPVNKINQSSKIQAELTSTYREREDHHSAESFNLILYIHFKFIRIKKKIKLCRASPVILPTTYYNVYKVTL